MKYFITLLFVSISLSFSYAADSFDIKMQSDAGEYIVQFKFWSFTSRNDDTIKSSKMYNMVEDQ